MDKGSVDVALLQPGAADAIGQKNFRLIFRETSRSFEAKLSIPGFHWFNKKAASHCGKLLWHRKALQTRHNSMLPIDSEASKAAKTYSWTRARRSTGSKVETTQSPLTQWTWKCPCWWEWRGWSWWSWWKGWLVKPITFDGIARSAAWEKKNT